MTETELKRPEMKLDAAPLTEADKYDFLPYIDRGAAILPSEQNTWKTDEQAQAFIKALKAGEDLTETDWSGINLKGADLSGFDLRGVNLSKANLMNTNFSGCNLEWTDFSYAYCEGTDFSDACMKDAQMKGIFYKNCKIDGAEMDEETKKYLQTIEWFLEQIESGKIDLSEIPQDQLNYLDLRTIDMSRVELPEDIDLSAIVLTGVNLSGVYIPKGHFLNMALMEKTKMRFKLIMQRTQKTLDLMYQKLKEERQEKVKKYGAEQARQKQTVRDAALKDGRPKAKLKPETTDVAGKPETTDVSGKAGAMDVSGKNETAAQTRSAAHEEQRGGVMKLLGRQPRKMRHPKTNLKKRA